ncbi:MAG TPA: glycosyltransferase family 39 protein, partial [Anaerolineales bacterium]|nr:glycosyltransferase family 39 protein [Anaerolineales bacterium]
MIIAVTRLGVGPAAIGAWGRPTIPFWEWQIALVWLVGLILILLHLFDKLPRVSHPDLWIGIAIWIGVSALWLSQPIRLGSQAGPRAPNFELYPFSDAMNYATYAQSILIGNGLFTNAVPPRVLYIVFLASLHALAGQDYAHVIALQSLILAFFPVALYFLGKEISGRPLGIMLAILAATRDVMTGLSADYAGNFSYSKFYLSELPTALLLILFTIFLIRASKHPSWLNINFVLAGGILGLATLMRTQSAVLLPPAFLIAFLSNSKPWKEWIKAGVILIITLVLTIAPWFWRNTQVAGGFVLDDPGSQMMWRAMWFNSTNEGTIPQLAGETASQYSKRLTSMAVAGFLTNPSGNIHAMLDHFANSEIDNVVLFPVRSGLQSLSEIFIPTHAFWEEIGSDFSPSQLILIGLYLLIFGLGVGAAWHIKGWLGLIPLTMNLAYNFSMAIFLSSGMRFLLTADWGFYFYYALGLLTLTRGILLSLETTRTHLIQNSTEIKSAPTSTTSTSWKPIVAGCLIFFLLGSSIPISEHIVPKRYQPTSRQELIEEVNSATPASEQTLLQAIAQESDLVIVQGRALYPRYYEAGKGEPGTAKMGYEPLPQARLVFSLIGDENITVIFNLSQSPEFFPNASDVILIAQRETAYLSPLVILVKSNGQSEVYFASTK